MVENVVPPRDRKKVESFSGTGTIVRSTSWETFFSYTLLQPNGLVGEVAGLYNVLSAFLLVGVDYELIFQFRGKERVGS
jgi:hypothetical protein